MASTDPEPSVAALSREVAALDSYEPSPRVMDLFDRLSRRVRTGTGEIPLGPDEVADLRAASAAYQCEVERDWSDRVASAADPAAALAAFPFLDKYRDGTRMEHEAFVERYGSTPDRAVFVGCGPLPLSTLLLVTDHGWDVTVVDRDPDAVAGARAVFDALGVDVSVREADGAALDYGGHDLVHVAALVGLGGETGVYERIHETADDGTPLLTRTAHGRRRVLYPPLPDRTDEWFDHAVTVDPPEGVLTSATLFEA